MSNSVLVTRARGDETELTEALQECGLHVIHEPLTDILLLHTARLELQQALEANPNAIIVTSRHGARGLAILSAIRDLPVLCVGESTLAIAHSLGFDRATATGGTADDMIEYILSAYDDDAQFVYPSADHIRNDLPAVLAQHGMHCQRVVVYEIKPVESFSDILVEHIRNQNMDAVTFMSARSAQIFMQHLQAAKLEDALPHMAACCMSKTIAKSLNATPWKKIAVSDEPTLASLANCVDNALR